MACIGLLAMLWAANSPWESFEEGVERALVIYGAATTVRSIRRQAGEVDEHPPYHRCCRPWYPVRADAVDERGVVAEHRKGSE